MADVESDLDVGTVEDTRVAEGNSKKNPKRKLKVKAKKPKKSKKKDATVITLSSGSDSDYTFSPGRLIIKEEPVIDGALSFSDYSPTAASPPKSSQQFSPHAGPSRLFNDPDTSPTAFRPSLAMSSPKTSDLLMSSDDDFLLSLDTSQTVTSSVEVLPKSSQDDMVQKSTDVVSECYQKVSLADQRAIQSIERLKGYREKGQKVATDLSNFYEVQVKMNSEVLRSWKDPLFDAQRLLKEKAEEKGLDKINKVFFNKESKFIHDHLNQVCKLEQNINAEEANFKTLIDGIKVHFKKQAEFQKQISSLKHQLKPVREALAEVCEEGE